MATNPELTPAEYLTYERQQTDAKHEYLDGRLVVMGGASREHNLIVVNTVASLHGQLRGRGCEVYSNDMRVKIPTTDLYTYPDIMALYEPPDFEDDEVDTLLNPSVILEVLTDRTNKAHFCARPQVLSSGSRAVIPLGLAPMRVPSAPICMKPSFIE